MNNFLRERDNVKKIKEKKERGRHIEREKEITVKSVTDNIFFGFALYLVYE